MSHWQHYGGEMRVRAIICNAFKALRNNNGRLPTCRGCGGGPGRPLPSRERNRLLMSNLNNTTLAASISPLPLAPGQSAAVPHSAAAATATAATQYTNVVAALACGSKPDPVANPTSAYAAIVLTCT